MAQSTPLQNIYPLPLPEVSYPSQIARQRMNPNWRPNGFERFPNTNAILSKMPTIGEGGDVTGYAPGRFAPIASLEEDFPVRNT